MTPRSKKKAYAESRHTFFSASAPRLIVRESVRIVAGDVWQPFTPRVEIHDKAQEWQIPNHVYKSEIGNKK